MIEMNARMQAPRDPVFDQRGPNYTTRAADAGSKEVAQYARRQIITHLERRMQHPTGHYVSTLDVVREGPGWKVEGEGTVYGRWLEGVDRRQLSGQVRWKGYRAFRTISQRIRTRAAELAWPAIRPWIRRLGGMGGP
jgi:hypothetical protein